MRIGSTPDDAGSPRRRVGRVIPPLAGFVIAFMVMAGGPARADEIVAVYHAYWAGLPAGEIRLEMRDGAGSYSDRIEIRTEGLPRLVTHFRGAAQADGSLAPGRPAAPARYDALYNLRKRHDSRISMRFVGRGDARLAERGPRDTSRKPPLAERFRRDAVDPITAVERLREAIAAESADRSFSIPVYDGARRFDVIGRVLPQQDRTENVLHLELSLRPIAGFKGESSDDGDPDDAPRPVAVTLSDDPQLLPLSLRVRVFFLPLVVRLDHLCTGSACRG
ncbi:MAG: DUF3108 domain-containing protein [Stellaceae bacterium]